MACGRKVARLMYLCAPRSNQFEFKIPDKKHQSFHLFESYFLAVRDKKDVVRFEALYVQPILVTSVPFVQIDVQSEIVLIQVFDYFKSRLFRFYTSRKLI